MNNQAKYSDLPGDTTESSLWHILSGRLNDLEQRLVLLRTDLYDAVNTLKNKNREIDTLRSKIQVAERKKASREKSESNSIEQASSLSKGVEPEETVEKLVLRSDCASLVKKIQEMEKFFGDYGLMWIKEDALEEEDPNNLWVRKTNIHYTPNFDKIFMVVEELNLTNAEPQIIKRGNSAQFQSVDLLNLTLYADGMQLENNPFRPYDSASVQEFFADLEDGYFPTELKGRHPEGVVFKVQDKRSINFSDDPNKKRFVGTGQKVGTPQRRRTGSPKKLSVESNVLKDSNPVQEWSSHLNIRKSLTVPSSKVHLEVSSIQTPSEARKLKGNAKVDKTMDSTNTDSIKENLKVESGKLKMKAESVKNNLRRDSSKEKVDSMKDILKADSGKQRMKSESNVDNSKAGNGITPKMYSVEQIRVESAKNNQKVDRVKDNLKVDSSKHEIKADSLKVHLNADQLQKGRKDSTKRRQSNQLKQNISNPKSSSTRSKSESLKGLKVNRSITPEGKKAASNVARPGSAPIEGMKSSSIVRIEKPTSSSKQAKLNEQSSDENAKSLKQLFAASSPFRSIERVPKNQLNLNEDSSPVSLPRLPVPPISPSASNVINSKVVKGISPKEPLSEGTQTGGSLVLKGGPSCTHNCPPSNVTNFTYNEAPITVQMTPSELKGDKPTVKPCKRTTTDRGTQPGSSTNTLTEPPKPKGLNLVRIPGETEYRDKFNESAANNVRVLERTAAPHSTAPPAPVDTSRGDSHRKSSGASKVVDTTIHWDNFTYLGQPNGQESERMKPATPPVKTANAKIKLNEKTSDRMITVRMKTESGDKEYMANVYPEDPINKLWSLLKLSGEKYKLISSISSQSVKRGSIGQNGNGKDLTLIISKNDEGNKLNGVKRDSSRNMSVARPKEKRKSSGGSSVSKESQQSQLKVKTKVNNDPPQIEESSKSIVEKKASGSPTSSISLSGSLASKKKSSLDGKKNSQPIPVKTTSSKRISPTSNSSLSSNAKSSSKLSVHKRRSHSILSMPSTPGKRADSLAQHLSGSRLHRTSFKRTSYCQLEAISERDELLVGNEENEAQSWVATPDKAPKNNSIQSSKSVIKQPSDSDMKSKERFLSPKPVQSGSLSHTLVAKKSNLSEPLAPSTSSNLNVSSIVTGDQVVSIQNQPADQQVEGQKVQQSKDNLSLLPSRSKSTLSIHQGHLRRASGRQASTSPSGMKIKAISNNSVANSSSEAVESRSSVRLESLKGSSSKLSVRNNSKSVIVGSPKRTSTESAKLSHQRVTESLAHNVRSRPSTVTKITKSSDQKPPNEVNMLQKTLPGNNGVKNTSHPPKRKLLSQKLSAGISRFISKSGPGPPILLRAIAPKTRSPLEISKSRLNLIKSRPFPRASGVSVVKPMIETQGPPKLLSIEMPNVNLMRRRGIPLAIRLPQRISNPSSKSAAMSKEQLVRRPSILQRRSTVLNRMERLSERSLRMIHEPRGSSMKNGVNASKKDLRILSSRSNSSSVNRGGKPKEELRRLTKKNRPTSEQKKLLSRRGSGASSASSSTRQTEKATKPPLQRRSTARYWKRRQPVAAPRSYKKAKSKDRRWLGRQGLTSRKRLLLGRNHEGGEMKFLSGSPSKQSINASDFRFQHQRETSSIALNVPGSKDQDALKSPGDGFIVGKLKEDLVEPSPRGDSPQKQTRSTKYRLQSPEGRTTTRKCAPNRIFNKKNSHTFVGTTEAKYELNTGTAAPQWRKGRVSITRQNKVNSGFYGKTPPESYAINPVHKASANLNALSKLSFLASEKMAMTENSTSPASKQAISQFRTEMKSAGFSGLPKSVGLNATRSVNSSVRASRPCRQNTTTDVANVAGKRGVERAPASFAQRPNSENNKIVRKEDSKRHFVRLNLPKCLSVSKKNGSKCLWSSGGMRTCSV